MNEKSREELLLEIEDLKRKLYESNDTLEAIRTGMVDALVIQGPERSELYTIASADQTYRVFIERMGEGALTLNQDGIILYSNNQFASMLGYTLEKVIGHTFKSFIAEENITSFTQIIDKGWVQESKGETTLVNSKSQKIFFVMSCTALTLKDGPALSILLTNVSDQKKIESELIQKNEELKIATDNLYSLNNELEERVDNRTKDLKESEAKFRNMIEHASVAICILSGKDLLIETVNDKSLQIWGKNKSIIGKPLLLAIPELKERPFVSLVEEVFTSGLPFHGGEEIINFTINNEIETAYFNFSYTPLKDTNGKVIKVMTIGNDMTDQVKARKDLEQAEEMLRLATESAELGTWFIHSQTREFILSPRMKQIIGFQEQKEMPYELALGNIDDEYKSIVETAIENSISNGQKFDIEYPITRFTDNKRRWVRSMGKLCLTHDGKSHHMTGVLHDITERKQDELRKNDFIGIVSHELKTPLTSLKGYLQLLIYKAQKNNDLFTATSLEKADKKLDKMTSLINGFLSLSQMEAGKIQLNMVEFDLEVLISEIIEESLHSLKGNQVGFKTSNPKIIHADRDKIGQVIANFLSNAIKYSPKESEIVITSTETEGFVTVSVKDSGYGISLEDQKKIFDRFYRVENVQNQTISGFGIGLYLCAEIIERHHGKIYVESFNGEGSTFNFSLPNDIPS